MASLQFDARREAIIAAAMTLATGKGLLAASAADVAAKAGTSTAEIYRSFNTNDDLLAAVFERAATEDLDATSASLADDLGSTAKIRRFIAEYRRVDSAAFQLWLDAWAAAARRPAIRAVSQRLNLAWQQLLADLIVAGVAAAEFSCADPHATAWRLLSLLDGLSIQAVAHPGAIHLGTVVEWGLVGAGLELGVDLLGQRSARADE